MTIPPRTELTARSLFGRAITLDLPTDYIDASDLRQIPDNQEVFLSPSTETSLVLEVLAMVDHNSASTDLWSAVKYHFDSIASDNASTRSVILTPAPTSPIPSAPSPAPTTPRATLLAGTQTIQKFAPHTHTHPHPPPHPEPPAPDDVWIAVALWRCWLEDPSHGVKKAADVVGSVNVNLSAEGGDAERARVEGWWGGAVGSLRVLDWGLFGDAP